MKKNIQKSNKGMVVEGKTKPKPKLALSQRSMHAHLNTV